MKQIIKKSSAGKRGESVRSDCYFEIEIINSGGIKINLKSKVETMYGESIKQMILDMSKFFGLKDVKILCEDNGALPFVLAARFELAVKRLFPDVKKEYLLPFHEKNLYSTKKDQLRRSRLYLPGNEPKFFVNAGLHSPDGIILDLEDSVAPSEKDAAQLLVRNALRSVDFYGAERMVRINQLPKGLDDLKYIVPNNLNVGVSEWKWNIEKLIGNLGQSYKILECSMKAFPTEALTHTHLSATLKVVTKNNISYNQIESVTLTTLAQAYDILFDPHKYRPESRETADHSLPYCIAAALIDHKVTTQSFSDEKLKDPRIWEVIDRIKGEPSREFEMMFPAKQPSKVVVKTKDGREFSEYLEYPKGDPREPMTMEDLDNKFEALSSQILVTGRRKEIKDAIFNAELMTAKEFMKKMII